MPLIEIELYYHPIFEDYGCNPTTGDIYSLKNDKIILIKQDININGYMYFNVYNDEKVKSYRSNRFIYECHNNEILDKNIEIDHIDKNKLNNSIDNLRKVSIATNNKEVNEKVKRSYEDELPKDKFKLIRYNDHYFENTWYSPTYKCLYKISDGFIFKTPFKTRNRNFHYKVNKNELEILDCN